MSPEADAVLQEAFPAPLDNHPMFRLARDGRSVQIHDTEGNQGYWAGARDIARARGFRSPFSDHIVELLGAFADQP